MPRICANQHPVIKPPDGRLKVALIGEAPGRDEEANGIPFIGAAGRELDRWLSPFFVRGQCYIGNLCQERPPGNELKAWFLDSKCTVPNDRLAGWIEVLRRDLDELRPNIVIALGRHPLFILTGKDGITRQWGSVLPCTLVPGLKVIALPHPSFVMRGMFDLRPIVKVWMRRAKVQSAFPEYRPPQRELVVDPSLETVMFELERLMSAKELAFDIETIPETPVRYEVGQYVYTPDIITCISFSDRRDWSICVPFSRTGGSHRWTAEIETQIWRQIGRLLGQEGPLKIAHNLMFDSLQLAGRRLFVAPPYYDTMVAHNRANLDLTKKKLKKLKLNSLAFCTALYTEEPYYKSDHKDDNKSEKWRGQDIEFWTYNAKDSVVLHEIKAATENDLREMNCYHLFERDMRVRDPLAVMGIQGVLRDTEKIKEITDFVDSKITLLQDELDKQVGYPLNTKSSQQMQKFLYHDLGLQIQFNKTSGRPTADEGAIAKLYQKTKNPLLKSLTELTRFRGFRSGHLSTPIGEDNRTRTTYNQARASTLRISSSDAILGQGKNLQTIPSRPRPGEADYNRLIKEFKRTYIADPGYVMWKRDYKQAEAMVVDYMAENLEAINDYAQGIDKHCKTLAIIYETSYETAFQGYLDKNPEWIMKRNVAKPTRHGFNYLLGENKLSEMFAKDGVDIPAKQCRRFLQALAAADPPTVRWHHEVEDQLKSKRVITNPWGRPRLFLGMIDNDAIREAIAFGPQSAVGDLLNFALERIYYTPGLMETMDFLLQQHDAVIGQSPTELLAQHIEIVGQLMEIPMTVKGREFVIPSDCETGKSWGDLN